MKKPILFIIVPIFTFNLFASEQNFITSYRSKPFPLQKEFPRHGINLSTTHFQTVYDLRNTNYLTSVKNQDTCGACWTFATMAAVESFLKKNNYGSYDLSEQNLKNLNNFDKNPCSKGGDPYMSQSYFSRGGGPVLESEDPYNSGYHVSYRYTPQFYIGDSRHLPKNSSNSTIKQAILDHGAIFSTMYWHQNYFANQNNTYYSNTGNYGNHAITLVGWNDTLSTAASQKGAWIVKNSYGTGWGENGYFYISYYDNSLHDDIAYWPQKYDYGDKYFANGYDEVGLVSYYGFNSTSADCIMRYTPNSIGEKILKIGTWAVSAGATISIDIYDTFDGNQLSSKLTTISSQTCSLAGFYSFSLPDTLALTQNDDVFIKVSYTTPNFNFPVPIECYYSGYADPVIETDRYYYKPSNGSWSNTTSDTLDLCIKVYGFVNTPPVIAKPGSDTTISEGENLNLMFSIFDNENDSLSFTTISKPNNSQIQFQKNWRGGYTVYFIWQTGSTDGQDTPYQLIFNANDGIETVYDTTLITVKNINTAPSFSKMMPDTLISSNTTLSYDYDVIDPDNDPISWSILSNISNCSIDTDGVFQWIVGNHIADTQYSLIIKASDGTVDIYDTSHVTVQAATDIDNITVAIPDQYELFANYPNPFNPSTTIRYGIPQRSHIKIQIFDIRGDFVEELENSVKDAGFYSINWKTGNIPTGIYFYQLESGGFSSVKKCLYVK